MSELDQTKVNIPEEPEEEFTLEQILSEYKSEAFMRDERKLSKDRLEEQAEQIIAEMRRELEGPSAEEEQEAGASEAEAQDSADVLESIPEVDPDALWDAIVKATASAEVMSSAEVPQQMQAQETEPAAEPESQPAEEPEAETETEPEPESEQEPIPETEPIPGPKYESEEDQEQATEEEALRLAEEAEKAAAVAAEAERKREEEQALREKREREREELRKRREAEKEEKRKRRSEEREELRRRREEEHKAKAEAIRQAKQEWLQQMADLGPSEAAEKYASGIPGLQRRTILSFLLCAVICLITLLGGRENTPIALLQEKNTVYIILLALQAAVMACGWDISARGIATLAKGKPGFETLVLFANLAALGDALWSILGTENPVGLPYNASAALTTAFALLGTRMGRTALRDSFRTMRGAKVPTVVQVEPAQTDLGPVISKHLGGYRGFIARMVQQDPVNELYRRISLLLIALCVFLALLASIISGNGAWVHTLAGLAIASASCTALLAYHRTFSLIARRLAGRGAAIAGWSGAEEIRAGEGLVLRDSDLFPEKTVSITGMKVLSGTRVEQIISYTGSMIIASGSGLSQAFGELMRQYAAPTRRTDDFLYDADGGFSASIAQDRVYIGTGAYMSLKGIQIPANIDVNGAIYTAVNGKLCALFIVEYSPSDVVRSALISLDRSRLRPIYAIRDFDITPAMIKSKFRLSGNEVAFPPAEDRFRLSVDGDQDGSEPPAAIMTREGINHYLEVIRCGRRLVKAVRRSTAMTIIGSVLAIGIITLASARGAFSNISAWNLIVFQLGWTAATLLISDNADGNR
jgi:hypothetical protein